MTMPTPTRITGIGPLRPTIRSASPTAGLPSPEQRIAAQRAQTLAAKRIFEKLVPREAYDDPPDWD